MSLDVYLKSRTPAPTPGGSGIFLRAGGLTKEVSREEWDRLFPGREPRVLTTTPDSDVLFWANVTHNLGHMAREAGLHGAVWCPEEHGFTHARQLIAPLRAGLERLVAEPDRFKAFNPANLWGSYDNFVPWVGRYLAACEEFPDAEVEASR